MSRYWPTFRVILAALLGLAVFAGFLYYIAVSTVLDRITAAETYIGGFDVSDAYNRFRDEIISNPQLTDSLRDRTNISDAVGDDDLVEFFRELFQVEYIQGQAEGVVDRFVLYINQDTDDPGLYVEVGPFLDNIEPTVFRLVDERIDGLTAEDLAAIRCVDDAIALTDANQPLSVLDNLSDDCQTSLLATLTGNNTEAADAASVALLEGLDVEQGQAFLKESARTLLLPGIQAFTAEVWVYLDEDGRVDALQQIANTRDDLTREAIVDGVTRIRNIVAFQENTAQWIMLAVGIIAAIALGLIHLPNRAAALRWPGVALLLSGVGIIIIGIVVRSLINGRVTNATQQLIDRFNLPAEPADTLHRLTLEVASPLTENILWTPLTLALIGLAILAVSLAVQWRQEGHLFGLGRRNAN